MNVLSPLSFPQHWGGSHVTAEGLASISKGVADKVPPSLAGSSSLFTLRGTCASVLSHFHAFTIPVVP